MRYCLRPHHVLNAIHYSEMYNDRFFSTSKFKSKF